MKQLKIAILGGGHGGCAAAVHLGLSGHEVRLYNRTVANIQTIIDQGGLHYSGVLGEGFLQIPVVTDDLAVAVTGADVVMVVTPRYAHPGLMSSLKELLEPTQLLFLNTGCGSAYYFERELGPNPPVIAETNTLTYGCRRTGDHGVAIYLVRKGTLVSVLPESATDDAMVVLRRLYPDPHLTPVSSPLETLFNNNNAVMHPPGMIANAATIERGESFRFYFDGTTPAVGRLIEALDRERGQIVAALDLPFVPFIERFYQGGYTTKAAFASGSAYKALRESEPNRAILGPDSLNHRYLLEDVGWGLVPMAAMAARHGVPVPVMEGVITVAGILSGRDYRKEGLGLERLGLNA